MKIIETDNLNQARKEIQELKKQNKKVIVRANSEDFNRKILENKDVDILFSPEIHNRKDSLKQQDSGLNEVLCKLAKKNEIKIGINLEELIKAKTQEKAEILARIMQNIELCKRTKTEIVIYQSNFNKQEIQSLFRVLGASTQQAIQAQQI
jgi:ribonuclease P/MRP protein subunit RPP1